MAVVESKGKKPGKKSVEKQADSKALSSGNSKSEGSGKPAVGKKRQGDITPVTSKKGRRSVESVMAAFQDARASDVSDKVFVATSEVHGKGLFATKRLKAGTMISRLHGMPTFDDGIYVLWITDELGLELTNDLKYINHDKNPNAAYSDLDVTIVRDVEAGEELLHDYGW